MTEEVSDVPEEYQKLCDNFLVQTIKGPEAVFADAEEQGIIRTNLAKRLRYRAEKEDQVVDELYISSAKFEAAASILTTAEW